MSRPATPAPAFIEAPAANPHTCVHQFAATPAASGLARRQAAATLRAWKLDDLTDTTGLLVSELVTNAVWVSARCAHNPPAIALRLSWAATSLILEVWDRDDRPPVLQELSPDAEGGRGFHIVEALSKASAYYPSPTGQGKVVWCLIEAPAAPAKVPPENPPSFPPLPLRQATTSVANPVAVFDDLALLRRVVEGLRALDSQLPRGGPVRY